MRIEMQTINTVTSYEYHAQSIAAIHGRWRGSVLARRMLRRLPKTISIDQYMGLVMLLRSSLPADSYLDAMHDIFGYSQFARLWFAFVDTFDELFFDAF